MTFNQIKYFLAIVDEKIFSHAADNVFISESSLSKQIKSLEVELGVLLFSRDKYNVELTDAGKAFLIFARHICKEYSDMKSTISVYSNIHEATYKIKIGTIPVLCCQNIIDKLSHFEFISKNINIDFVERDQAELIKMLDRNQIDFAVVRTDYLSPDVYDFIQITSEKIGVICSQKHPLASKKILELKDLDNEVFFLLNNNSSLYKLSMEAFKKAGISPKVNYLSARHELLLAMVNTELCLTLLPMSLLNLENRKTLKYIPLKDNIISNIALVRKKNSTIDKKTLIFQSAIKKHLNEYFEDNSIVLE